MKFEDCSTYLFEEAYHVLYNIVCQQDCPIDTPLQMSLTFTKFGFDL